MTRAEADELLEALAGLGALMRGRSLTEAARMAVAYTCAAIRLTAADGTGPRMGVRFEAVLADYGRAVMPELGA